MNKKIVILILGIIALISIMLIYREEWKGGKTQNGTDENIIIRIDGFDVNYQEKENYISIEDVKELKLGSTQKDIEQILGKPDEWVGGGITQPVYFLENKEAVVLYYRYPEVCEELNSAILYDINGKATKIIQE
ncbi:MAG: hypothetical protein J5684_03800 [Eubacterium sp.]|nr:hypothetical protein [Eubacterium sp.]